VDLTKSSCIYVHLEYEGEMLAFLLDIIEVAEVSPHQLELTLTLS
jgi:hypothetical protein